MTLFDRNTSVNNMQPKVDWIVNTRCNNNRIDLEGKITRKIKYSPLLVSLGLQNTSLEFDVIRSNYFCYTYTEMYYILKFGYIHTDLNKEINFFFFNIKVVDYTMFGASEDDPIIQKFFCASNTVCVIEYNDINDFIELRTRVKSSIEYVDGIERLLLTLHNFKSCATCNRRLQIWAGEEDLEKIVDYLGGELNESDIAEKIFDILR